MSLVTNPYDLEEVTVYTKKPTQEEIQRSEKVRKFADKFKDRPDIVDAIYAEYENNPNADFNFDTPKYDKSRKYWNDAYNSGIVDKYIYNTPGLYQKQSNSQPYTNKFTYTNPAWAAWERQTENELKSLYDAGYVKASNYLNSVLHNYGPEAYTYAYTSITDNIEKGYRTEKQAAADMANHVREGLSDATPYILGAVGGPLALQALGPTGVTFIAKQIPWMVGSELANRGLDVIGGDDPDHWANNRYVRGLTSAIGMGGGNFFGNLAKGVTKYGFRYIPKAAAPVLQKTVGSTVNTAFSLEGMAAADHLAEELEIDNPYLKTGMNFLGMVAGQNVHTTAANTFKNVAGTRINNLRNTAYALKKSGHKAEAIRANEKADNLYKVIDNSLVSKALDVRGSGTKPWLFNTIANTPMLVPMVGATYVEDKFGTDILHNPIAQIALTKGAGKVYKVGSNLAYGLKQKSGGAGDVAQVMQNVSEGNKTFTGTYSVKAMRNSVLKKLFPDIPPEKVTEQMLQEKYDNASAAEKGYIISLLRPSTVSNFSYTKSATPKKGYVETEHRKGVNPLFNSAGRAYQGITSSIPANFTPEQFYTLLGSKSGPRQGFGAKYSVYVPKTTVVEDFRKTKFVDSKGVRRPLLVKIGNRYILHPEYKFNLGMRGQDTFMGIENGRVQLSNVAGHVATIGANKQKDGSVNVFKIGSDTSGYGDTAKRYQGASQLFGSILGKGLDYFTPNPGLTIWGEYLNPTGKMFGTTTNVQTGQKKNIKYKAIPTNIVSGMIPLNMQHTETRGLVDHLKVKQNLKVKSLNKDAQLVKKTKEKLNNYNNASKVNKALGTSFTEGSVAKTRTSLYKVPWESVTDVQFLKKAQKFFLKNQTARISPRQKEVVERINQQIKDLQKKNKERTKTNNKALQNSLDYLWVQ